MKNKLMLALAASVSAVALLATGVQAAAVQPVHVQADSVAPECTTKTNVLYNIDDPADIPATIIYNGQTLHLLYAEFFEKGNYWKAYYSSC